MSFLLNMSISNQNSTNIFKYLFLLLSLLSSLFLVTSTTTSSSSTLSTIIGSTHWNPCYYIHNELPSLLDGSAELATMNTQVIKLAFSNPETNYPWNSDWNATKSYTQIQQLAAHPYFQNVFNNTIPGYITNYSVYILVAFTWNSEPQWCQGEITPSDEARITSEFANLTSYLITTYTQTNKRFIYQNWEGDWAIRCATYNPNVPPSAAAMQAMIKWLSARQAGVNQGRSMACKQLHLLNNEDDCDKIENGKLIHTLAGIEVFLAAEVNLVAQAIEKGKSVGSIILNVIPYVQLDMVSYSSYDTMKETPLFGQALDFIAQNHNPTPNSPSPAVYVGEYGVAQNQNPAWLLESVTQNVIAWGLSKNSQNIPRAAHIMFWELYDNEAPLEPTKRCQPGNPIFNTSELAGFYLVMPNHTYTWPYYYLQGVINGTIPQPIPNNTMMMMMNDN